MTEIINPLIDEVTEEQLRSYIIEKDSETETDYNNRVAGVSNKIGAGKKIAGYNNLRDFFDGDHWSYLREDGSPIRVFNYCRTTVLNYTAFLTNEPPEIDVPPRDITDDVEVERVEQVEKLIDEILEENKFAIVFDDAVQNQSLLGDCFIFGPYIEWAYIGNRKIPQVKFVNVKRVEQVRPLWSDENFEEMDGFIFHYRISVKKAERIFRKQMEARGITSLAADEPTRYSKETMYPMVTINYYWDRKYMEALINKSKIIDFVKHNWGFVPGEFVKNLSHPTNPWGVSDIEDILDAQVEYNENAVDTRAKIRQVAVPKIFYSGEGEPVEFTSGQSQIIKLGLEDRIWPDPIGSSTAPFNDYQVARKNDIHNLSMISDIFYGGTGISRATGRALSVLMQGVNNKVKKKQQRWRVAIRSLIRNILVLLEFYIPESKNLIQGYYKSDVFFPGVLLRNVTEEVNKFNMKLQSQETTMKNIGIPSPKDEKRLQKKEWNDQDLMIEISRNPQLRMQLQQMLTQKIEQQRGAPGQRPQLTEGEALEPQPAAVRGVPEQSPISEVGEAGLERRREG